MHVPEWLFKEEQTQIIIKIRKVYNPKKQKKTISKRKK